mgnify:CR=1 FL=1
MSASDNKGSDTSAESDGTRQQASVCASSIKRILNLLGELKSSNAGAVLYQHVERMLMEVEHCLLYTSDAADE